MQRLTILDKPAEVDLESNLDNHDYQIFPCSGMHDRNLGKCGLIHRFLCLLSNYDKKRQNYIHHICGILL